MVLRTTTFRSKLQNERDICSFRYQSIKKFKKICERKKRIARYYEKNLNKNHLLLPYRNKNCLSSYHLFIIKIKGKTIKKFRENYLTFKKKKFLCKFIISQCTYNLIIKKFKFKVNSFPNAEKHAKVLYQYQYILDYLKKIYTN